MRYFTITLLAAFALAPTLRAQGSWPAWSSPTVFTPGELDASLAPDTDSPFRFRISATTSLGLNGSHDATRGVDTSGNSVTLDTFRHSVNIDMYVLQPSVSFAASDDLNIELRLPLRRLVRRADIIPFQGATPGEIADMQRHLDLHHPSRTLTGIGDLQIEMHSPESQQWRWGFSLPTGHTEPNPYVLGEDNEAHEHVQFGTGTVVPRGMYVWAEDNYMMSTAISLPLYANSHGFTPPAEFNFYAGLRKEFSSEWRWSIGSSMRVQGYGDWNGTRDINTGYAALLADVALTNVTANGSWHYGVMIPLVQELFSDGSDMFEFGPTFAVTFSPVWGD